MKNLIILDTHILLWSLIKPEELSENIKQKIEEAQNNDSLIISSITLWEIAMLNLKKKISIYGTISDFLKNISEINGLKIIDISPKIAAESVLLMDDFHGDPADRIIVATARVNSATLITRDQKILDWAQHGYLNVKKG